MENGGHQGPVDRDDAKSQLDLLAADRGLSGARAAAPWWLIVLQGASVAGFALSFGLGNWQSAGFVVSALFFVGLRMIRPAVTRTHAEPWSRSRSAVLPGLIQMAASAGIIAIGVIAYDRFGLAWALWPTALIAGGTTVVFGIMMERALTRDIVEGI